MKVPQEVREALEFIDLPEESNLNSRQVASVLAKALRSAWARIEELEKAGKK